jgi:hypothetical protein
MDAAGDESIHRASTFILSMDAAGDTSHADGTRIELGRQAKAMTDKNKRTTVVRCRYARPWLPRSRTWPSTARPYVLEIKYFTPMILR